MRLVRGSTIEDVSKGIRREEIFFDVVFLCVELWVEQITLREKEQRQREIVEEKCI